MVPSAGRSARKFAGVVCCRGIAGPGGCQGPHGDPWGIARVHGAAIRPAEAAAHPDPRRVPAFATDGGRPAGLSRGRADAKLRRMPRRRTPRRRLFQLAAAAVALLALAAGTVALLWVTLPDPAPLARENPRTTALVEQRRAE